MKRISKKILALILIIPMVVVSVVGCGSSQKDGSTSSAVSSEPQNGGEITVAFQSSPENYDPDHPSSDWTVTAVTNHVYESLFEFDNDNKIKPQLAESYEVKNDGKTYDIKLRKGVMFQDNTEMTAKDVKASMDRWFDVNPAGVNIKPSLKDVKIVNDYEIKVDFNKPYAPFLNILSSPVSRQKMLVKKKDIVEKFGKEIITEHIGTGPYMFEKIVPDQKVVLKKFDNYTPATGELSGLTGKRTAYLDKVTIEFVPEESVRIAGLESGQFDFIDEVSNDRYNELENYDGISPVICKFGTMGMLAFNCGSSPFDNIKMRQAVAYIVDPASLAAAQVGDKQLWSVEDGSWFKEGTDWYDGEAGKGIYNAKDLEKAKDLVKQSGYNGEKITVVGVKADNFVNNGSLVLQKQLESIGLNVELELTDKAAYYDSIQKDKGWNITLQRWSDMNPDPQVFQPWTGTNGWITNWDDEYSKKMDEIFTRMESEMDPEKRYEIVKEFYQEFWTSVPYLKLFNDKRIYGINDKLQGYQSYGQPYFWNVWIQK